MVERDIREGRVEEGEGKRTKAWGHAGRWGQPHKCPVGKVVRQAERQAGAGGGEGRGSCPCPSHAPLPTTQAVVCSGVRCVVQRGRERGVYAW